MSYTNAELVRRHIGFDETATGVRRNYPVVFADQEWVDLPGRNLVDNSILVKAVRNFSPVFESAVVIQGNATLSKNNLVAGSATIASDDSLGTIYRENSDYTIDYINGMIDVIEGGAIPADSTIAVWYFYYSIYSEGSDYSIDYVGGMIRRFVNSEIQPGQTILVDFELAAGRVDDILIVGAVAEANALVEKQIDPHRQFGADTTLQTAATYLAVSILCRMSAAGTLAGGTAGHQTAAAWLSLADNYRRDYDHLLKTFRPRSGQMSGPTHS